MGKSVKGTKTEQNLLKSFAGESQARTRYTFFASKAKKEGFEQIAGVFAETADQEKEHAERFFKFLEGGMLEITASYPAGKIGTTMENLIEAAAGENEEWSELYPTFAKVAEEEGFPVIAAVFRVTASCWPMSRPATYSRVRRRSSGSAATAATYTRARPLPRAARPVRIPRLTSSR